MKDKLKNTIFENIDDAVKALKDDRYKKIGTFTYKKDDEIVRIRIHFDLGNVGYKILNYKLRRKK